MLILIAQFVFERYWIMNFHWRKLAENAFSWQNKYCMIMLYNSFNFDWLIDYLQFYVPLKNFSLIWRRHHCRWRAAKFRPMLGAQGLWAGRDLYRVTPTVTRGLGFSGLIRRTAPFSRLLRLTRGCGGSIITRIVTGIRGEGILISSERFVRIR